MQSKAKLIALSGICAAAAIVFLTFAGYVRWAALISAVIASVATAIPILLDYRNWVYSVCILFVSGAVGMFLGLANVMYVTPIVTFCMPFSIVKAYGESTKRKKIVDGVFEQGDLPPTMQNESVKQCLPNFARWILYFVLLEVALGLTALFTYLFAKPLFLSIVESKALYWILGAAQIAVILFDMLMRGCFIATKKIIRKAVHIE